MCNFCSRFDPENWNCAAFPDGIPNALDLGGADHRLPLPGDKGILYRPENAAALAIVNDMWGLEPEQYMGPMNLEDPSAPSGPSDAI